MVHSQPCQPCLQLSSLSQEHNGLADYLCAPGGVKAAGAGWLVGASVKAGSQTKAPRTGSWVPGAVPSPLTLARRGPTSAEW
jgi:hypothetical protein